MSIRLPIVGHDDEPKDERERVFELADATMRRVEECGGRKKHARFGMCWDCQNFTFRRTRYNQEYAICEDYNNIRRVLREEDPVVECTMYVNRYSPTLSQMWSMATLINPPGRQIGFLQESNEEGELCETV